MNSFTKNRKLLALCSAAIICASSYGAVEAAVTSKASHVTSHVTTTKTTPKTTTKTTTKAKPATTTAHKQKYKDGTYTGVGQTQIGAVQVQITLKKDKITNCKITGFSTHYPISDINPILPQELLQRQNPSKIDVISGATLSTEDFYFAVEYALQQAQKAQRSV